MMKRMMSLLLCVLLLASSCLPVGALAAASRVQITERDGDAEIGTDKYAASSSYESGKVVINKSIKGTDIENVFDITLDVTITQDLSEIKVAQDAAVVIVIDSSGSMKDKPAGSDMQRMDIAKASAEAFIQQFGNVGDSGAHRLVAVVDFATGAKHMGYNADGSQFYWLDVANEKSRKLLIGEPGVDDGKLKGITQGGNTNIEAGLQLAQNLLTTFWNKSLDQNRAETGIASDVFSKITNKMVIVLTDGMPTHYIDSNVLNTDAKRKEKEIFIIDPDDGDDSTTDDVAKDACYGNNIYLPDAFTDENYTTYKKVTVNDESVTVTNEAVRDNYSLYRKHVAYPGSAPAKTVAKSMIDAGIKVYGMPVDMPEIFVEKISRDDAKHFPTIDGKKQKHWTYSNKGNTYYTYYSATPDADGRTGAAKWMKTWCTDAFNATTDFDSMMAGFTSAFSESVAPWLVTDSLPDYVSLVGENDNAEKNASWLDGSLSWNLVNDKTVTSAGTGSNKTYTYSYTYRVALDTTSEEYRSVILDTSGVNTNNGAKINYLLSTSSGGTKKGVEDFPHPKVRADYSGLTFVKTDKLTEAALSGVGFSLAGTATGSGKPWSQTVTSDANGAVAFANIPAGTYMLTEMTAPEGYQQMNPVKVMVGYGNVVGIREILGVDDEAADRPADDPADITVNLATGSSYGLLNDRKTGSLTISKEEGPSVVETAIDRGKAFAFDVVLTTETYYGSQVYVPFANKEFEATLTDKNNGPEGAGTTQTVKISTDREGKVAFNASEDFTLGLDDSIVISGLPVGTRAAIRETPHENFELTGVTRDGGDAQLVPTGPEGYYVIEVRLDNTETANDESAPSIKFTNTRKIGSVKVSKETIGTSHAPNKQFPFQMTVYGDGEYLGAELVTGDPTYKAAGSIARSAGGAEGIAFFAEEPQEGQPLRYTANFSLAKGDVAVLNKLPVGFKYELKEVMTEEQADDYLSDQPENGYTGTIAADEADQDEAPVVHAFTNIRRTGSLIIRKQVEGNGAAKDQLFTYEITLDDRTIHTDPDVEGVPVNGEDITATLYKGSEETGTELEDFLFNQGVARVELAHDQYVVIDHLPTETQIEVRELSDAEMRGEAETPDGQNEGVKTEEELEAERREEEEKKKDPNYGKLGYADYEVWVKTIANGVSSDAPSAVATGAVCEDAEGVIPLTVLYTNIRRVGDLTIQKKVAEAGDYKGIFDFTLTVTSDRVRPDQINGWYGDLWFKDGVSQFKLGHLQSVTAKELPAGAQYSVVEDSQGHNQSAEGLEGVIVEGGQVWVSITNWLPFLPETGDDSRLGLMLAVFACSVAGLALFAMRRRRSRSNG